MKRNAIRHGKAFLVLLALFGLFVGGIYLEASLRAAQAVAIPVDGSGVSAVTMTASRKPDFLWIGTAWWIDYESPVPFELDIGSGRSSPVPAGKHRIFRNHDYSNLDQYGLKFAKEFPEAIVIRRIAR